MWFNLNDYFKSCDPSSSFCDIFLWEVTLSTKLRKNDQNIKFFYPSQRRIQNPIKHLKCRFFAKITSWKPLTFFHKKIHLRCLTGFEYVPQYFTVLRLNPFVSNTPFLYLLKTSENLTVFWCFQGVEKRCLGKEWVNVETYWQMPPNHDINYGKHGTG